MSSHPLALFSLKPCCSRAEGVVAHPSNRHLVSELNDGTLAIDIGFNIRSRSCGTLATLGRGDTDIFVEGSSISKVQCSFEIDPETNVIMLYDRSHSQTTQVFGENAIPFQHGRLRKIVVQEGLNGIVGMGGVGQNLVMFALQWHQGPSQTMERVRSRPKQGYAEDPRLARTVDLSETAPLSRIGTRTHTPGPRKLVVRYKKMMELGAGSFGTVHKAIDVDTGKFMAVKVLREENRDRRSTLKREVEILSTLGHPHIVDYITSQGWDDLRVEIFMGLKEGNLESLVEKVGQSYISTIAETVFNHMLQALDFLAVKKIIHRDVKPENILYISRGDAGHHFQLGDFGVCNNFNNATTVVGTPAFMAPEIQNGTQTCKMDVWSLFVTMLWTLDVKRFRQKSQNFASQDSVYQAVSAAAVDPIVNPIREMARTDPEERASAAQMLVKCFGRVGLTTPQKDVQPVKPDRSKNAAEATTAQVQTRRFGQNKFRVQRRRPMQEESGSGRPFRSRAKKRHFQDKQEV
ncbi:kinase-like protein [Triangularia verruculosa]|uniref:non-specific serine/threonine protein kinase n=1 Tax=Triangularia verruculosa TaxID=2587418 RepID=A0AAN6XQV5_9PEZI|nr:kinase-like protein [Triangularia verruculosa]